jgi:HEAT repeat protein
MATDQKPRTPWLLVALALIVVGGVYLVYDEGRFGQMRDLDYWASTPLTRQEIEQRLTDESADSESVCHALIQLERQASSTNAEALIDIPPLLSPVFVRGDDRVRQLCVFAARAFRGTAIHGFLVAALEDEVVSVRLEAAVGLAALRDERAAPLLADAIDAVRPDHVHRRRELLRAYSLVAVLVHKPRIMEWLRVAQIDDDSEAVTFCNAALAHLDQTNR